MKSTTKIGLAIIILLTAINSFGQTKNLGTANVKVYGNCDQCKATIEKAGDIKNVSKVAWDKDTKIASISYDSQKTNPEEILKRIAAAGYDNEAFLAPPDVYEKLPSCCQYERALKPAMNAKAEQAMDHSSMITPVSEQVQQGTSLKSVFSRYFSIKDALVSGTATVASATAKELSALIGTIPMDQLSSKEHAIWMKVSASLITNAERISMSNDIAKQRTAFAALSKDVYQLAKVVPQDFTIYYQHCPMYNSGKGADWLSKENDIKNPYYGAQMLNCGQTVETIKP